MTKAIKSIDPDVHFRVLHLLQEHSEFTQREFAQKLGVSLGGVKYFLKALIQAGHIKAGNFSKNSNKLVYLYLPTPQSIKANIFKYHTLK